MQRFPGPGFSQNPGFGQDAAGRLPGARRKLRLAATGLRTGRPGAVPKRQPHLLRPPGCRKSTKRAGGFQGANKMQ